MVAKFVGPKSTPRALQIWFQTLNHDLRGAHLLCVGMWERGISYFHVMRRMRSTVRSCYVFLGQNGVHACFKAVAKIQP